MKLYLLVHKKTNKPCRDGLDGQGRLKVYETLGVAAAASKLWERSMRGRSADELMIVAFEPKGGLL